MADVSREGKGGKGRWQSVFLSIQLRGGIQRPLFAEPFNLNKREQNKQIPFDSVSNDSKSSPSFVQRSCKRAFIISDKLKKNRASKREIGAKMWKRFSTSLKWKIISCFTTRVLLLSKSYRSITSKISSISWYKWKIYELDA